MDKVIFEDELLHGRDELKICGWKQKSWGLKVYNVNSEHK